MHTRNSNKFYHNMVNGIKANNGKVKNEVLGTGKALAVSLALFCLPAMSMAETIAIPLGQQGKAWQVETPATGISKNDVEAKYGAPLETSGPVGEPPITIWEYEQFSVYFEYNHVIHAVVKHNANR